MSRFGVRIFIGLPTKEERRALLNNFIGDNTITDSQWDDLVKVTTGFSARDLKSLVNRAKAKIEETGI